jgi:hypothetical protein
MAEGRDLNPDKFRNILGGGEGGEGGIKESDLRLTRWT